MSFKTATALFSLCALSLIYPLAACGRNGDMHESPASSNQAEAQSGAPATQTGTAAPRESVPLYTYEVVRSWPHDTRAFTQGLVFYQGALYESTGQNGASTLRQVELQTGKVLRKVDVDERYFAEGMTISQGKIFQLTWTGHKGFIYDLKGFEHLGEFAYEGEGWGLTSDDFGHLIMSDGTNRIRFLDSSNFRLMRAINVYDGGLPLMEINELEYIKGEIFANVWKTDRIVRIDPQNGRILGWIDLAGLRPHEVESNGEDVLNGIAYDEKDDRLFVTGKRWPTIFEIRLKKK
jgi:glutamine cyclotransferase